MPYTSGSTYEESDHNFVTSEKGGRVDTGRECYTFVYRHFLALGKGLYYIGNRRTGGRGGGRRGQRWTWESVRSFIDLGRCSYTATKHKNLFPRSALRHTEKKKIECFPPIHYSTYEYCIS